MSAESEREFLLSLDPLPFPIRQKSANGVPKPATSIERTCHRCGASFIDLAPGLTGERGLWIADWRWVCSQECADREPGALV